MQMVLIPFKIARKGMVPTLKSFKTLQNKICTTHISYPNRRARDDLNKKKRKEIVLFF